MKINMKIDSTGLNNKMTQAKAVVTQSMPQIFQKFVQVTPIDTGNARSHSYFQGKKIFAKYEYASVLNDGRGFRDGQMRGSDQAPNGMVGPTTKFAVALIKQKIASLGR